MGKVKGEGEALLHSDMCGGPKEGETSELSWKGRRGGTPGSFQGPLKLARLVTQHWLQV